MNYQEMTGENLLITLTNMYKITALEKKNNDWYILNLVNQTGVSEEGVSVNRTNKKGETFPNFDALMVGGQVDGKFWKSDAGKKYLFAPELATNKSFQGGGAKAAEAKGKMVEKAMDRKEQGIARFQDEKERAIMISSTASQATEILVALYSKGDMNNQSWNQKWLETRYWLVKNWTNIEQPKIKGTDMDYPQSPAGQPNFAPNEIDDFSVEGINPDDIPF